MPQLIVQADDLAITHATTLGIVEGIVSGVVRATGIFTNRPDAAYAARALSGLKGVDIGIDLNFVTGSPLLPAGEVPGLVRPDGSFRSSHEIKATYPVARGEGVYLEFEVEPFDQDQTLAEARAQVQRFLDLFGRPPAYVHHHALTSVVTDQVLHEIADEYGLLAMDDLIRFGRLPWVPNRWYTTPFGPAEQCGADPVTDFADELSAIRDHEVSVLITHPGYVDAELLDISSFNIIRARDLQLVTSPRLRTMLEQEGVELASYTSAGIARGW